MMRKTRNNNFISVWRKRKIYGNISKNKENNYSQKA